MKGMIKRAFQKKLECFVWISIIILFLILFLMIYHGKIVNAIILHEDIGADVSKQRKLFITSSAEGSKADIYEEDNQPGQAWPIVVNNPPQLHTFHSDKDIDWVYFFGHNGYRYDMKADDGTPCDHFIKLSLADPNGKILISDAGVSIVSCCCSLIWECKQDGYYCLKIEPPSEYPAGGINYMLSIESEQGILNAAALGRVVNSKGEGLNGIQVSFVSSGLGQITKKAETGSLQNVRNINLDQSKIDGWYFVPIIEAGVYDIRITKDNPNNILKEVYNIQVKPYQIERIKDIEINSPPGMGNVISPFELVYTLYQNEEGRDYPVWEDNDKDGATDLYEFLYKTDPDDSLDTPCYMYIPGGWSMISIPVIPENASVSELFPGALVVYEYEKGLGYKRVQEKEGLKAGKGYWILLKEERRYTLTGQPVHSYTLSVNENGWDMVGGCISAAWVLEDSCHIGVIYGFDQGIGYQRIPGSEAAEALKPGKGYWILLNDVVDQCKLTVKAD